MTDPRTSLDALSSPEALASPEALPSPEALRERLSTLVAIPVTPFAPGGGVDWDAHAALIARSVEHGVGVLTPNGNTGEYYALT
jgi:4-hydroxy-tetrahydrodipicolinate synthase